ncbi:hypothetical protein GS399_09270 [Pedobacter sp. HMF7647]|uniref:Autotransporter outer membrane beta-barrel domain-containing protein n=1 Tax=Hufsiella arboris TaxID=2695275 RepID=A0A7K1YAR8_9SPHI|nr:hypothetical protein [Hufsiella arboris]MXV51158.1 hypothetical protein [Hufsiella arboris]
MKAAIVILVLSIVSVSTMAQKENSVGEINRRYIDSVKNSTWPYMFPAWGKKITKKGIDLQYPVGAMVNFLFGSQKVEISDLKVGINGGEMVPLDFVKFGEVKADVQTLNTRIDLWALPFVDIYGIFGKTWAQTNVNLVSPVNFSTTAKFDGGLFGFGTTLAGGFNGIFTAIDYNNTWSHLDGIDGSIHTQLVSGRLGYVFRFAGHPQMNLTPWLGAQGIFINRVTVGSINLGELGVTADGSVFQPVIDGTAPFLQNLSPAQQIVAKKVAKEMQSKVQNIDFDNITIDYSLKKQATSDWSMTAGGQFQLDKRWQFRAEAGFLGGRKTLLTSVNYRFGF